MPIPCVRNCFAASRCRRLGLSAVCFSAVSTAGLNSNRSYRFRTNSRTSESFGSAPYVTFATVSFLPSILRAGYGKTASQKDKKFEDNYNGAKAAGIPVGVYWYSYARTVDEARQEAEACITILRGKQFEYPIFFDVEEKATLNTGKSNCSAMIRAFCEALEKAGYWVGLYTSRSVLSTHIEDDIKNRYALWVAEWGTKLNYSGSVGIWQYSDKGKVDGINGAVDLDEGYIDYAKLVKERGLNGFTVSAEVTTPVADTHKTAAVILQIGDDIYKGTLTKA